MGSGTQWRAKRSDETLRFATRGAHQWRKVPSIRIHKGPVLRVEDGIDAGGNLFFAYLADRGVEVLKDAGRRQVELGVGADGRPELTHHRGGANAAAHHAVSYTHLTLPTNR